MNKKKSQGCGKPKKDLEILHGVSGVVRPGEMLAIIGGSGAGKSTLLDILANRKSTGTIEGEVLFNGTPAGEISQLLRRISTYVTQEDILFSTLSVRETLSFFAELRLNPKEFSREQRQDRVTRVLEQLRMTHRADARIGDENKRGLSGGEKKRVAIGCQLVADPSIIFLDEPTSGLDAYNSLMVMKLMRDLCSEGKTVVCTIHQPRSSIYEMFDQLLILDNGSTVYFGAANEATNYFESIGFPVPRNVNPADYFIDVLLSPPEARAAMTALDLSNQMTDFSKAFNESAMKGRVLDRVNESKTAHNSLLSQSDLPPFATSYWKQFTELLRRAFLTTVRDPLAFAVALSTSVILAFIIGSIFYQLGYSQSAIQGRSGVIFFIMVERVKCFFFFFLNSLIAVFDRSMALFPSRKLPLRSSKSAYW